MTELYETADAFEPERAVLVGVQFDHQSDEDAEDSLAELAALADTAGASVVAVHQQRRSAPDRATYVGSGKVVGEWSVEGKSGSTGVSGGTGAAIAHFAEAFADKLEERIKAKK